MQKNTSLSNGQSVTFERNQVITVTQRTVRFGLEVYQTHNISAFGEGEIEKQSIHWLILIILIIGGISMLNSSGAFGGFMILLGIAGIFWNWTKPKEYGLLITLNSGDKKLFITSDKSGLMQVIATIYEIIETSKETAYQITVNNSNIKGNFIQGSNFHDFYGK